jgi:RimJ/RimL family protein N-acetyltransferase
LERRDLEWLFDMKTDSWVTMHSTPIINMDDQHEWFNQISNDQVHLVVTRPDLAADYDLEKRVGYVSLTNFATISHSASVLAIVDKDHRNTKYSCAVPELITDFGFEMMNLRRLEAEVLDTNPAAMKFNLGLGYKIEGRRREAVYKCGKYHDSVIIGLLRSEWSECPRVKVTFNGICNTQFRERKAFDHVIAKFSQEKIPVKPYLSSIEVCRQMGEWDPKYDPDGTK